MDRQFGRWGCYIAFAGCLMFGSVLEANADACWDHWKAKLNAEDAITRKLAAKLETTGDCSLVESVVASATRYNEILRATPCERMRKHFADMGVFRRKMMRFCKPQAPATQQATGAPSDNATPSAAQKSASCSDITGIGGGPAATHCETGGSALALARAAVRSNPAAATEHYKRAAEAYQRAGDVDRSNAILQEALSILGGAIAANPPPQPTSPDAPVTGGASDAVRPATTPIPPPQIASANPPDPAKPMRDLWLPEKGNLKCKEASKLEQQTAAYFYTCGPDNPGQSASGYKPRIDFRPGTKEQVREKLVKACGERTRANYKCWVDTKLKMVLADDPSIGERCRAQISKDTLREDLRGRLAGAQDGEKRPVDPNVAINEDRFNKCVDDAFLYGPKGPPSDPDQKRLSRELKDFLAGKRKDGDAEQPNDDGTGARLPGMCPPGQGMKPLKGAFGAWRCQPLGLISLSAFRKGAKLDDGTASEADTNEAFELSASRIAAATAAAVIDAAGAGLSAADRDRCRKVAYEVVLSVLKGGAPEVPDICGPIADAARSEYPYYATSHVDAGNWALELLMDYVNERAIGPAKPGMVGIEPTARQRRVADCVRSGGTWESCEASVPAP